MALSHDTGAYIFGCEGLTLTQSEAAFFKEARPVGFILFTRNLDNPDQIRRLTSDLRDAAGHDAMVLIDQEGGRVERMAAPHWSTWLPPLDQIAQVTAKHGHQAAVRSMYLRYQVIAAELLASGIDVNCVPCSDVIRDETHAVLRNRCYGEAVDLVSEISRAVANANLDAGALPVMKHMPGHGRATLDSHLKLPHVTAAADDLQNVDFAVFKALSDLPLGMSAHIVYEALGQSGPATTSAEMIRLIREDIGFQGLLMTDDLSMEALSGTPGERSAASIQAGCDVILHCNGELAEMEDVAASAGRMTNRARNAANAAMDLRANGAPVDISQAMAELNTLI